MSEKINLKPCPFCGKKVQWAVNAEGVPSAVYCPKCKCSFNFTKVQPVKYRDQPFGKAMTALAECFNKRECQPGQDPEEG